MCRVLIKILFFLWTLLLASVVSAQRVMPIVKMYGDFGDAYTKGRIIVYDPDSLMPDTFDMYAKFRGASSKYYEKKNYAVKLVDSCDSKMDARLLGMRNDNSWILDAMAIDKARMRNRVAFDIWNAMDVKPYYYESEPKARTGISGKFVELYLNDEYRGIYCLNEKLDRKQLKLKKIKNDQIRGILYKGFDWDGTTFKDEPEEYFNDSSIYQGFESMYPDVKEDGFTDWEPLVEKVNFVLNSSNDDFVAEYATHFDVPVLINLHILINMIAAIDNRGKNQFFYIYDVTEDKKMSFAPWDMDASFGRSWDGSVFEDVEKGFWFSNNIVAHAEILDKAFLRDVSRRYFDLRKTVLASDSIKSRFEEYFRLFDETGAAQREYDKWNGEDGIVLGFAEEKEFINQFVDSRMAFLDDYYIEYYEKTADIKNLSVEISDQNVYDIFGRRVNNLQPGQFYIKSDGRLFFNR